MPIGELEPLYRYLSLRNQQDPVAALLTDMEQLAKGKYIKNMTEGIHSIISSTAISNEIRDQLARSIGPAPANYQATYQALGKRMYITINRISANVSKTALALVINEDDTVETFYIDPEPIRDLGLGKTMLYSSINTVVVLDDGTIKHGFLRCETSLLTIEHTVFIKCDFRLSRTQPFYLEIANIYNECPACTTGSTIKQKWEASWMQ